MDADASLKIGWATTDLTPSATVILTGLTHVRVSEGVKDPITATALALESGDAGRVVMVSCDLLTISDEIRDGMRGHLRRELPELPPEAVFVSATHTHTAPYHYARPRYTTDADPDTTPYGVELPVLTGAEYVEFAARRVADAVIAAWRDRAPGGVAYGLGHAVIGRNRLTAYRDGSARMYGPTNQAAFSHVEGYEDHSVHFLATYAPDGRLTGAIVNLACPAQAESGGWKVSADFWHEIRQELRARWGAGLYVLPQLSAAGDQDSRAPYERAAEQRMERLAGRDRRTEIAVRVADAADRVLPLIRSEIAWNPTLSHHVEELALPRRPLSEAEVERCLRTSKEHEANYEKLLAEAQRVPPEERPPRWFQNVSVAYRLSRQGPGVARRYETQKRDPFLRIEVHAVRLGELAFVTNPFEFYLDYGTRIKARSPALQTFVVQLTGPGSYVPTARGLQGGAYGAAPTNNEIGVEGAEALVEWSVRTLERIMAAP